MCRQVEGIACWHDAAQERCNLAEIGSNIVLPEVVAKRG